MEIRFLGHATFELSDGSSRVLIAAINGAPIPSSASRSRFGAKLNDGSRAVANARSGSFSQR